MPFANSDVFRPGFSSNGVRNPVSLRIWSNLVTSKETPTHLEWHQGAETFSRPNERALSESRANSIRRAIVRRPPVNFQEGQTTVDLGLPDYERALAQHEAYCAALENCGLTLTKLDRDSNYPDSTFVEDTAVIIGEHAVLTRPGAVSRTGEVASIAKALDPYFSSLETIQEPGALDGGDVCEAGNHYFVGISERTNENGARQLGERVVLLGRSYSLVDVRGASNLLHLKSGIAYLGDNRLAVIKSLAGRKEFASYELVLVDSGEEYAANCVRVNDHLLIARGYPGFAASATKLGYQTIELEMTEFQKMDGGLSCLSLRF